MKVSNISEVLIYVMISILILFFVLVFGKIIKKLLDSYEYFTEEGYSASVFLSSKKNDTVTVTPDMVMSDDFSPVLFKIITEDGDESDMFKMETLGKLKLLKDVSGNASINDSFSMKVRAIDVSENTLEANLEVEVNELISTYVNSEDVSGNDVSDNIVTAPTTVTTPTTTTPNNTPSYSELNNTINDLMKQINTGLGSLTMANSNNNDEEEFTNYSTCGGLKNIMNIGAIDAYDDKKLTYYSV